MNRAKLNELRFKTRDEALALLKKLWRQEKTRCPICGSDLGPLHRKAKKNTCDWQCKACNKTYKTIHLLDEINENIVHFRRLERPLLRSDQSARIGGTK